MRITFYLMYFVCLCCIIFYPDISFADVTKDTVAEIAEQFRDRSSTYISILTQFAQRIFYWCLVLEVALLGIRAMLNRAELADIISQFALTLLFAGFCFAVILNYEEWTGMIIKGISNYALAAGGTDLTLSPLEIGFSIMARIIDEISWGSPVQSLGFIIIGSIVMICFALMTARILVVLCESYIALSASILLLGFGGTSLLKDYALNTMRYALSVAFKLFVMQLVLGVGLSFINSFSVVSSRWEDLFVLIGCAVVLLVLVNTIPEIVAGIINGSHIGAGVGMKAAVTGAMAAAGGAFGAIAGGVAGTSRGLGSVSDAVKIASLEGHGGANKYGTALKNLWQSNQAARHSVNTSGSINQRMRANLKDRKIASEAGEILKD